MLHARLKEANTVAIETRGLLKAFGHATNASADYYDNERVRFSCLIVFLNLCQCAYFLIHTLL